MGRLVSEYNETATAYHAYDGLGSTDAFLDDNATATDRYQVPGLRRRQTIREAAEPVHVRGQAELLPDTEVELYFAGARYYDPLDGRWLSKDPNRFEAGDENLYRYVQNNPTNRSDPSGLYVAQVVAFNLITALGEGQDKRSRVLWTAPRLQK